MEELKKCAHCGGEAIFASCVTKVYIKCDSCGVQFVINYSNKAKFFLTKAWNRRV